MDKILTKAGLPNTCSICAKTVTKDEGWYADNEDQARAGGGVCADHVSVPAVVDADTAKADAKQSKADAKEAAADAKAAAQAEADAEKADKAASRSRR